MSDVIASETEELDCPLTVDERLFRAELMAKCVRDIAQIDNAKKDANSQFKAKREHAEAEIKRLAEAVSTGREKRPIAVERKLRAGQVETFRKDTSELVHTRVATKEELQGELFDDQGEAN